MTEPKGNAEKKYPVYTPVKQERDELWSISVNEGDIVWPLCRDMKKEYVDQLIVRLQRFSVNWNHPDHE